MNKLWIFSLFSKIKAIVFQNKNHAAACCCKNKERGRESLTFFSENAKKSDFCANCYFKGVIFVDFLSFDEILPLAIQKLFWYNI